MPRPVRIHPIFCARLQLALIGIQDALEAEIEFVGRHLTAVETQFSDNWDQLHGPTDRRIRWVDGQFETVPALFVVIGRLTDNGTIEIRSIRIVLDPSRDPGDRPRRRP